MTGVFDIPKFVTSVHLYMKGISTGRRGSKRRLIIGVENALDVIHGTAASSVACDDLKHDG